MELLIKCCNNMLHKYKYIYMKYIYIYTHNLNDDTLAVCSDIKYS